MDITLTNPNFTLKPYSYFIGEIFRYTSYIHIIFIFLPPGLLLAKSQKRKRGTAIYDIREVE